MFLFDVQMVLPFHVSLYISFPLFVYIDDCMCYCILCLFMFGVSRLCSMNSSVFIVTVLCSVYVCVAFPCLCLVVVICFV